MSMIEAWAPDCSPNFSSLFILAVLLLEEPEGLEA